MTYFDIEPPGLTPEDRARVDAGIRAFLDRGEGRDFVMHYRSPTLRVLLVLTVEAGRVADWLAMPCAADNDVKLLLAWWTEQKADEVKGREDGAAAAAAAALARLRKPTH